MMIASTTLTITPLLLYIFLPFFMGISYYALGKSFIKYGIVIMQIGLILLAVFLNSSSNIPYTSLLVNIDLPYGMSLKMDQLTLIFILLNNFLFLMTTLFGIQKQYFTRHFVFVFLGLEGLINAIFLSTDLFNIYILLEIATVLVAILIMTKKENRSIYNAMLYIMSNLAAMAFFLMGIGYCYKLFGVLDLTNLSNAIANIENSRVLILPFAFIMTAVSLKSAIMPLFSWLPYAHAATSAPSIVSAILSGIFVETGLYLIIRMQWLFGSQLDLMPLMLFLGYSTAILGFIFAIAQIDIKLILAYHTISQIGLILIGVAYNTQSSMRGALYHVISHGIFKSLLFLLAGILIEHYHTRNIKEMHNLWRYSKRLSIILIIAVLSITGAPFLSGAISKVLIGYSAPSYAMLLISAGTMMSFIKFFKILLPVKTTPEMPRVAISSESDVFLRSNIKTSQWISLYVLGGFCVLLGTFFPNITLWLFDYGYSFSDFHLETKVFEYVLLYALCIILYYKAIHKNSILYLIRKFDLSYNGMNITLVIFFFSVLSYLLII